MKIIKNLLLSTMIAGQCFASRIVEDDAQPMDCVPTTQSPTTSTLLEEDKSAPAREILLTLAKSGLPTEINDHIFSFLDPASLFYLSQAQYTYQHITPQEIAALPKEKKKLIKSLQKSDNLPTINGNNINNGLEVEVELIDFQEERRRLCKRPLKQALTSSSPYFFLWMNQENDSPLDRLPLALALSINKTWETLNLRFNGFNLETAMILAGGLWFNTTLKNIKLDDCSIGDSGLKSLATALKKKPLQKLSLEGNGFTENSGVVIEDFLNKTATLKKLNLNENILKDNGVTHIATALSTNKALQELDLISNEIGDDGAIAFAEALKTNSTLNLIKLNCNNISSTGAVALAEALRKNTTVTISLFENSAIDTATKETLTAEFGDRMTFKIKFHALLL